MSSRSALDGIPAELWRAVRLAPSRLLMLDYDGTLAPHVVDRMRARPLPGVLRSLRRIVRFHRTRVAIVSGRPVSELDRFVGDLPATRIGEHGWEFRYPDATPREHPLEHETRFALDELAFAVRDAGMTSRLERKRTALVLHTRGQSREAARALERRFAQIAHTHVASGRFALDPTDGGLELRAIAHTKGTAVRALLAECEPGTCAVFLGDDVSDEDAFAELRDRGYGIRVARVLRPTYARACLRSCRDVAGFLTVWRRTMAHEASMVSAPPAQ